MRKHLICTLICISFFLKGSAQDFVFKPYGTTDGLSHSLLKCFQEDDKGYLWIGTEYGLNVFDGLHFTTFLPTEEPNGIPKADISKLFKDSRGNLIIGFSYGGFSLYLSDTRTWLNYDLEHKINTPQKTHINSIEEEKDFLWIGTSNGLFKIDKNDYSKICAVKLTDEFDNETVHIAINTLLFDHNRNLWIGTNNGLRLLPKNSNTIYGYHNQKENKASLSHNNVTALALSPNNVIFVGTSYGLNELLYLPENPTDNAVSFKRIVDFANNHPATEIQKIMFSSQGDLWVGYERGVAHISQNTIRCFLDSETFLDANGNNYISTIIEDCWGRVYFINKDAPAGLFVYYPETKSMRTYTEGSLNQIGLKGNQISTAYIDSKDFLWLGTVKSGMFKCDLNAKPFRRLLSHDKERQSFVGNDTYAITQTQNNQLWIGTNTGMIRLDKSFKNPKHFKKDTGQLTGYIVGSLLEDVDMKLWIGYFDYKLSHLDIRTNRFQHYRFNPSGNSVFPFWSVRAILQDNAKKIWFTSTTGLLAEYLPKTNGFLKHSPSGYQELFNSFGNALAQDKNGTFWIATNQKGLIAYTPETGNVVQYLHERNRPESISSNTIKSLCIDANNRLWIGTEGGSLDCFNPGTNSFDHYKLDVSHEYYSINSIEKADNGHLWLGTNDGLVRFDPGTTQNRVFTYEDGLADNEFNRGASYKAKDGTMFFGGPEGVTFFHPDSILKDPYPPKVLLNSVQILGNPKTDKKKAIEIIPDNLPLNTQIELPYNENDITFNFTVIHNAAPTRNILKYKLRGFENSWKKAFSGQRFVEYTNLEPGEYVFQMKAENSDAIKSIDDVEFRVLINSPFWNTLWFQIGLGISILSLIYFWYHARTKALRDQKDILEKEVVARTLQLQMNNRALYQQKEEISKLMADLNKANELRLHFFTNISHELRTPLTLILGPVAALLKNRSLSANIKSQLSFIQRNSNRLLSLTNELLYIRKLASGVIKLNVVRCNITMTIKDICLAFEAMAQTKGIQFNYSFPGSSDMGFIDTEKLTKIVNNLLSNAFKYTPNNGKISVIAYQVNNQLYIFVKDSGIGIAKQNQEKVFNRYYRTENASFRNPSGAGIGLSLTKELVNLHKGTINLFSALGTGSTFTVELPVSGAAYSEQERNSSTKKNNFKVTALHQFSSNGDVERKFKNKTKSKIAVLLVEDNGDMSDYIKGILENECDVTTAENGIEALQKIKKTTFHLIVSDVMMPNMNGFELCQKLKTNIETCHIPIILLTAKASENSKLEGLGTGADDYLTKPFNADILLLKIKNIIVARKVQKERFQREALVRPSEIELHKTDEIFLNKAILVVERSISDTTMNVEKLCKEMAMSKPVLNKKLTALTDLPPSKFIRQIRLKRAAILLQNDQGSVREIMYETGFSNSSYFAKIFKQNFGVNPTEYAASSVS